MIKINFDMIIKTFKFDMDKGNQIKLKVNTNFNLFFNKFKSLLELVSET